METIFENTDRIPSLFTLDLPINEEYKAIIQDTIRMIMIQTVVNILFFLSNPTENSLFSTIFLQSLLFIDIITNHSNITR